MFVSLDSRMIIIRERRFHRPQDILDSVYRTESWRIFSTFCLGRCGDVSCLIRKLVDCLSLGSALVISRNVYPDDRVEQKQESSNCKRQQYCKGEGDCFPPYPRKNSAAKVGHPLLLRTLTLRNFALLLCLLHRLAWTLLYDWFFHRNRRCPV
jgi:hypothetical protein